MHIKHQKTEAYREGARSRAYGLDLVSLRRHVQLVDACAAPEESSGELKPTCTSHPASRGYVCQRGASS